MSGEAHDFGTAPPPSRPARLMALFMSAIIVSAGLVAVFIGLAVCYEIFVRSVLGRPVIWVDEITTYLVGYITFVGMGAALYEGSHNRKSTRLNSSHVKISYAVFCLKK